VLKRNDWKESSEKQQKGIGLFLFVIFLCFLGFNRIVAFQVYAFSADCEFWVVMKRNDWGIIRYMGIGVGFNLMYLI